MIEILLKLLMIFVIFSLVKIKFKSGKYSLVIGKDEIIIKSELTGIKPLINLLDDKKDCKWFLPLIK